MATTGTRTPLEITLADTVNLAPGIIVESALFGVLTLLVAFLVITVARQGITTRSRVFMVLAMGIMYIASGIHWSVNVYTFIREIRDPVAWAALPIRIIYRWSVITTAALFLNFWFSDIIVMWRAVVVWEWNRRVTVPCAILIVVPLGFAVANVATSHGTVANNVFRPNIYGIIALAISLFSNILATSLIGVKAWVHRRTIRAFFGTSSTSSAVQNTLILLVESGFLYCAIWALFIISTLLNKGSFAHTAHTISGVVPQLVGLYPSIIILLVALQKTHCDRNFTYGPDAGGSLQFAAVSGRSTGFGAAQIEDGNVRGTTTSHQMVYTVPISHSDHLEDIKDRSLDIPLNSEKGQGSDASTLTAAGDRIKHGSLVESDSDSVHAL